MEREYADKIVGNQSIKVSVTRRSDSTCRGAHLALSACPYSFSSCVIIFVRLPPNLMMLLHGALCLIVNLSVSRAQLRAASASGLVLVLQDVFR